MGSPYPCPELAAQPRPLTPLQVRNLRSCIKVALDFVSPDALAECAGLREEFRWGTDAAGRVWKAREDRALVLQAAARALAPHKAVAHLLPVARNFRRPVPCRRLAMQELQALQQEAGPGAREEDVASRHFADKLQVWCSNELQCRQQLHAAAP